MNGRRPKEITAQAKRRTLSVDGAQIPLTKLEVTILRVQLEEATHDPERIVERLIADSRRPAGAPSKGTVARVARGLIEFLLTGKIADYPDIARWRAEQMAAPVPAADADFWMEEADRRLAERAHGERTEPGDESNEAKQTVAERVERMIG